MVLFNYNYNYISLIDKKLLPEIVDKILEYVFEDFNTANKQEFILELDEVLYINNLNKIQLDIQSRFKEDIPLSICCVDYIEDLDDIIYYFSPEEPKIIYYNEHSITNDITRWLIHNIEENDYNLLCPNQPNCGCCNSKEDFVLTQRDLIDILIILFFTEIDYLSDYLNIDNEKLKNFDHRYLEGIELNMEDGNVYLEYFNGS